VRGVGTVKVVPLSPPGTKPAPGPKTSQRAKVLS